MVLPAESEVLAAAAGNATGSQNQSSTSGWRGCFMGLAVYDGRVLETLDAVLTAEACCRVCRARQLSTPNPNATTCNCFNHCGAEGGCRWEGSG